MSPPRNLLILFASGLRSDALDDERAWPLATPRMSRLASRGLRLVATSACPDDPGALVSLLTGLHARQHGILRPTEPAAGLTLPDAFPAWLRAAGYHVAGVGCVGPIAPLLDTAVTVAPATATDLAHCAYGRHAAAHGFLDAIVHQRRNRRRHGPFDPDRLLLEPADDADGFIAAHARHAIDRLPAGKPWAMIVIFAGPGSDLPPPPPYSELVNVRELRAGFTPIDFRRVGALAEPAWPRAKLQRLEPAAIARIRADYLGRVALIDHGIGRILDAAHRRADHARTWTLLASDRGHLLGEHGLVGPRSFLAGGIETPFILAGPPASTAARARIDETSDDLLSTVDIAATIAALAGADAPAACVGRSLLPTYAGDQPDDEAVPRAGGILSEWSDRAMIETERFKALFHATDAGRCLGLIDMLGDPDEKQPLTEERAGTHLIDSLRARLAHALLPLRCPTPR